MGYDVRLVQVEARPLAVVRRRARADELSRVVPEGCGLVCGVLRQLNVSGVGRHVALYLDDSIHLEIGAELESPFGGCGEVMDSSTPAGPVATTRHWGPYAGLQSAHQAIHAWCARTGHLRAGPRWEIYGHWEDDWNTEPGNIVTDVFYLLKCMGDQS